MDSLFRDLRHSFRLLWKEKLFSFTVIFTLAACVGANASIFSVVHRVLLAPLPYAGADRLVAINNSYPNAGAPRGSNGSVDYFQRREHVPAFEHVAQFQNWGHTLGEPGQTERAETMRITPQLFPMLGVAPILGRNFLEEETREGSHRVVILSHGYWQDRYDRSPSVIGQVLRVDGESYQVVGVMARDFRLPDGRQPRVFVPIPYAPDAADLMNWHSNNYGMFARLRPGATIEQARAQNDALNERLIASWTAVPNAAQMLRDVGYRTLINPLHEDMVRDIRPTLWLLWAGVAFVMLIGCVNIANIMLARAQARVRDVATRLALGASTARLAREIMTHALLLALLGGAAGAVVAVFGIKLLLWLGADQLPRGAEIGLNGTVLLFTLALAIVGGLVLGAIPLFQLLRRDLRGVLQTESRGATAARSTIWVRSTLVTAQVALAFLLLIGAGLLLASFRAAQSINPGFRQEGLWSGFMALPQLRYPDDQARAQFVDELLAELGGTPGVAGVAVTTQLPFTGNNSSSVIMPEGYEPPPGESLLSPRQTWISPDYFETLGIPLLEGRAFNAGDRDSSQVIILDEWLAHRYFGGESPLGKRMVWGAIPGMAEPDDYYTIVGVVGVVKHDDLTADAADHFGAYYFPFRRNAQGYFSIVARTSLESPESLTAAVRERITRMDPELPLFEVQTLQGRIDDSLRERRSSMVLLLGFAGLALLLAVLGIYGVLAYVVAQHNRELAVRMAFGCSTGGVFKLVLNRGLRVTVIGLAVGAVIAAVGGRVMRTLLYGIEPLDPFVHFSVAALLGTVAVLACLAPARQAARTDPAQVLGET